MARSGRPKVLLELTSEERRQLERWALRPKSAQALALRSRIVLHCADGLSNKEVAARAPESAVVLCVDEKSQVQALSRSQPAFPMMPGMPEKRTHDYVRHGTTSLFAAFDTSDGKVITSLHRRHRTVEFRKFLNKIDQEVPDHLDVHLVCDNYGTHKTPAI